MNKIFLGSGGKSKHERFKVIDQDGNFQLKGYNEALAAKKSRENDFKKNFGPKGIAHKVVNCPTVFIFNV